MPSTTFFRRTTIDAGATLSKPKVFGCPRSSTENACEICNNLETRISFASSTGKASANRTAHLNGNSSHTRSAEIVSARITIAPPSLPQLQLLIATQNQGKALEFLRLLANTPVSVLDLRSLDPIPAPEENGATFVENAVVKAQYYAAKSGITVLADDSGLEVDALDGRPGVMSARYGGSHLSDAERVEMLLEEMADVPDHERSARFKCVVAFAGPSLATDCITAEGVVEGSIALAPRGANGFGYDPVFVPLGENRTTAQMTGDEKDRLSHRARAIQVAMPKLLILLQP